MQENVDNCWEQRPKLNYLAIEDNTKKKHKKKVPPSQKNEPESQHTWYELSDNEDSGDNEEHYDDYAEEEMQPESTHENA
eukprot:2737951-Ditylum_brightwellii.AAC.1